MALILNIETSTRACSVALGKNGIIAENGLAETLSEKSHASKLTVFIQDILNRRKLKVSDLDAISVSKGPGSYTGLRIGVSVAKGLAYGANLPLIAINTLQAMAYSMTQKYQTEKDSDILFCPMIDARRMEVYVAFYDNKNNTVKQTSADIIDSNSYLSWLEKYRLVFFGTGAEKCKNTINHRNAEFIENIYPSAANMLTLSELAFAEKDFEDVAYFEPFYLKDFIATKPKSKVLK